LLMTAQPEASPPLLGCLFFDSQFGKSLILVLFSVELLYDTIRYCVFNVQ